LDKHDESQQMKSLMERKKTNLQWFIISQNNVNETLQRVTSKNYKVNEELVKDFIHQRRFKGTLGSILAIVF
jgi:hypothetical protein